MKRKVPKSQRKLITISYELLEVQKFIKYVGSSEFSYSTNQAAYRRFYKGNGVELLLSRGRNKPLPWSVTITTQAKTLDQVRSPTSHVMNFKFNSPVFATDAIVQANQIWLKDIQPELEALALYADEVNVVLRAVKNV